MDNENVTNEVLKSLPPVGVSALAICGVPISDIVCVLTLIYVILNIFCTLLRTYSDLRCKNREK